MKKKESFIDEARIRDIDYTTPIKHNPDSHGTIKEIKQESYLKGWEAGKRTAFRIIYLLLGKDLNGDT